jgi:hypothetical protein
MYFNHKTNKFKECAKLKDVFIETIAWDENSSEFSSYPMLIGSDSGNLISYQSDIDPKKDMITEKMTTVINLKQRITGIGVFNFLKLG